MTSKISVFMILLFAAFTGVHVYYGVRHGHWLGLIIFLITFGLGYIYYQNNENCK